MSSRILRRLQEEDKFDEKGNSKYLDVSDERINVCCGNGARCKNLSTNPFEVLIEYSSSESDTPEDDDDVDSVGESDRHTPSGVREEQPRRKKKKKKRKCGKDPTARHTSSQDGESEIDEPNVRAMIVSDVETLNKDKHSKILNRNDENKEVACHIKMKYLNVNNELKKMFGSKVIDCDTKRRNRGRLALRSLWLVNPKETWPPLEKNGISMKVERINGICRFTYVHNDEYKVVQRRFLQAVNTFDQENIMSIIQLHPYHIDSLIQMSEIYKLAEDLQVAAELIERALYCLESAFHPLFNMARGICKLDYRCQQNRALFICLFKHLTFVGQRACYETALELCKLLLSLDFELDPLAVVLCIDFYALRSRNYGWLIATAEAWERRKNLSQLPNFAFSTALAHFRLAETHQPHDFTRADKLLQDALIAFPATLKLLLEKCSVHAPDAVSRHSFFNSYFETNPSRPLMQLITLYVNRNYHEWKSPNVVQWIEKSALAVLSRVESGDPFVQEWSRRRQKNYSFTPRNVIRHIFLSDIEEVTLTVRTTFPSPVLSFDPVPPADSVDLYSYAEFAHHPHRRNLTSLFFASLLPNFRVDDAERNLVNAEDAPGAGGGGGGLGRRVRQGVRVLVDAIGAIVAGIQTDSDSGAEDVAPQEL